MHDTLVGLLDKVDTAVAESAGVLERSELDEVARLARDIRLRLSYPESVVVVALAGGTGSGKSSLLNAVAGEEVALTGGIRPMTSEPLALVPVAAAGALAGYLDVLGINERVEHRGPTWLCLLDLPDNDSVEVDHRHQVDLLLPRVDLVVWVTDPEKYRDASLHHAYIAALAAYQAQFIFVLNQIDLVDEADAGEIEADLVQALGEDGIVDPEVIATAASPVAGPPMGIDRLLLSLERARDGRRAVHRKSLTDLTQAASGMVESASGARGVDFESRWASALQSAIDLALDGKAAGGGHELAALISQLAGELGGETGELLQSLAADAHVSFVGCVADSQVSLQASPEGARSWLGRLRGRPRPVEGTEDSSHVLPSEVDQVIGDPIRQLLVQRGRAHAAITDLALALDGLERRAY